MTVKKAIAALDFLINNKQKIIFNILKEKKKMDSGDLYREAKRISKQNLIPRTYRNHMKKLQELELVKEIGFGRWKKYEIVI